MNIDKLFREKIFEAVNDSIAIYKDETITYVNTSFKQKFNVESVPFQVSMPELYEMLHIPNDPKGNGDLSLCKKYNIFYFPLGEQDGLLFYLRRRDILREVDETFSNNPLVEECLKYLLHNPYEGLNVVDKEGRIVYMSRDHEIFFGIPKGGAIGRHVRDIIKNTRLHIVAKTGVAEVAKKQEVKEGEERIVVRIPLRRDEKVVGAIGKVMFKDFRQLQAFTGELEVLRDKISDLKEKLGDVYSTKYSLANILGESPAIQGIREIILHAANTALPVLITGESGTGKELIAQAIHAEGKRHTPFIPVNCSAIPEGLVESELFGYERGAFTGADRGGKIGKFELGDGGTVFLDEIADMPVSSQTKLLRVLQEGEIQRIGGSHSVRVNFRLISATNRDLKTHIEGNRFRPDLFYRINAIHIDVPPLRERREDISFLVQHVLAALRRKFGGVEVGIHPDAMAILATYDWPGNVRELINVVEWSGSLAKGGEIVPQHLPGSVIQATLGGSTLALKKSFGLLRNLVRETEENAILHALTLTGGNHIKAAKILGIHRSELYRKLPKIRARRPVTSHSKDMSI